MVVTNLPDDFYERLRVPRTATPQQIKKAYRKKALELRPDRGENTEQFIAVKEAYDTLSDPEARRKHDRGDHDASRGGTASPPPDDSGPRVPVDPYVTPDTIQWRVNGVNPLEPVTVRLSNRYGVSIGGECYPESWSGPHWQIVCGDEILEGNDLYDFTIAPNHVGDLSVGTHNEEVRFMVDDRPAIVTINFVVSAHSASTHTADGRTPPSSTSWSPSGAMPEATPTSPTTTRPRLGVLAIVLFVVCAGVILALIHSSTQSPSSVSSAPTIAQPKLPKRPSTRPHQTPAGTRRTTIHRGSKARREAHNGATAKVRSSSAISPPTRSTLPPLEGHSGGGPAQVGGSTSLEGHTNEHPSSEKNSEGDLEGTPGGSGGEGSNGGGLSGSSSK